MSVDDDKTPVDMKWCRHCRSNAHKTAQCLADHSPDRPAPCGAPIRARDGSALGYVCNLSRGHLGKHAQVFPVGRQAVALVDESDSDAE